MKITAHLFTKYHLLKQILLYVWQRGQKDSVRQWAASLTYTTLLSMVPLLSVSFAIFSAFPAYDSMRSQIQQLIFEFFTPEFGKTIEGYFETFISATGSLPATGIIFLIFSSVLMLFTVNNALNRIFHVQRRKGLAQRLLVFWALLTLFPILLATGLSLMPATQNLFLGANAVQGFFQNPYLLPFLLEIVALMLLFIAVPNCSVPIKDAFMGAALGAFILEVAKWGFVIYLAQSSFSSIYGTFALVPAFLIWLFVSWNIILFSAVVTASLPEIRAGVRHIRQINLNIYNQFHTSLSFLNFLWDVQKTGGRALESEIIKKHRLVPWILHHVTRILEKEGWIQPVGERGWVLARNLDDIRLHELFDLFTQDHVQSHENELGSWHEAVDQIMNQTHKKRTEIMAISLDELFNHHDERP